MMMKKGKLVADGNEEEKSISRHHHHLPFKLSLLSPQSRIQLNPYRSNSPLFLCPNLHLILLFPADLNANLM